MERNKNKQHILIVEDEVKIARFLELELEYEGYQVTHCKDGREGLEFFQHYGADLILLDVMMPRMNGIDMCRRVREFSQVPIIMLTAKDDTLDKVMGLDMGANDYVTKPFAIEELLARIRANIKKGGRSKSLDLESEVTVNNLNVNFEKRTCHYQSELVELTKKEFDLLAYLLKKKNVVVARDEIIAEVWGFDYFGDTNVVDVYIRYLRSKLDEHYGEKIIHTVRGVGYTIKDESY